MADQYQEILQKYWGYPDFRGIQREIIESIASGKDTLGLMPTGGGKSITFQVPALAKKGVCIVVTPLIALMKDQVQHLKQRGILAEAIHTGMSRSEIIQILENCIFGEIKFLYASPERLSSEIFLVKLKHIQVSFITIDEAHCISQWGYDFRPSYLNIANIRKLKPEAPVLALTATATPEVVKDIMEKLEFAEPNVFRMSFERKNLSYIVRECDDKRGEMIHILRCVEGSAIVYVRSRKHAKEIAQLLCEHGINALFYHAGLESAKKDERQKAWQQDEARVMVATNAFGMGIDKPDVRMVIHIDCPDSLEAYFQEAGRAGRDGEKAYAVLLFNGSDERKLQNRINDTFPEKDFIRDVYEHLAYFYQIGVGSGYGKTFLFQIDKFCYTYKYFPTRVDSALRILERAGYIHYEDQADGKARLKFCLGRNDLYMLENLSKPQDDVITALLRNYGGLFTDYAYIDLSLIAYICEQSVQQVYMTLKTLSARHILDFIPQSKTPYITYTQRREDGDRIIIPASVWEDRREQYVKRINAIINYAKNDEVCRSRQLLEYFGENSQKDCQQCDVCIENKKKQEPVDKEYYLHIAEEIKQLLADGKYHEIKELKTIKANTQDVNKVARMMVAENIILIDGLNMMLTEK